MTTVQTEQLELPRPASWKEKDAWRVAFTLVTDHLGQQFFSVNASTNSAMTGTNLEELDVTNPRAALWVDYRGKGYTFHWHFDLSGPVEHHLRGRTTNQRAQRRASSKVADYAPQTYHDAIYLAVFQACDAVWQSDGFKLLLDSEKERARTKHVEYLDSKVVSAMEALTDAERELATYVDKPAPLPKSPEYEQLAFDLGGV